MVNRVTVPHMVNKVAEMRRRLTIHLSHKICHKVIDNLQCVTAVVNPVTSGVNVLNGMLPRGGVTTQVDLRYL
jgi:hypothetical protein